MKYTWARQLGFLALGLMFLSACSFPPPTTSDDAPRSSNGQATEYTPPAAPKISTSERLANNNARINAMQEQIDQLKGKLEVISYESEQQRQQSLKSLTDMDARLSQLENKEPMINTPISQPATGQLTQSIQNVPTVVSTKSVHSLITNITLSRNLPETTKALESWITENPKDKNRNQALLAMAQGLFKQEQYPRAVQAYQSVIDEYPSSDEACQARHHQGLSFLKLEDPKNAKLFFQETVELCPKSVFKSKSQIQINKL